MAIGVTRSAGYTYTGATGAFNGINNGTIGTPGTWALGAEGQVGGSVVLYSVNAQASLPSPQLMSGTTLSNLNYGVWLY
jgi:hypothetical protein